MNNNASKLIKLLVLKKIYEKVRGKKEMDDNECYLEEWSDAVDEELDIISEEVDINEENINTLFKARDFIFEEINQLWDFFKKQKKDIDLIKKKLGIQYENENK